MRWSDLPLNPSRRMLRQFAGLWIVFFGLMAAWRWYSGEDVAARMLAAVGAIGGAVGLVAPAALRPIFVAWTVLVFPIGWVVSRVILLLLFGVVITPVALFFRLRGRDVLMLRRPAGATSYWTRKPAPSGLDSYFRQS